MRWPLVAALARLALALGGGWWLANLAGLGIQGNFIAVAIGVTAYGAITACGVRASVWTGAVRR